MDIKARWLLIKSLFVEKRNILFVLINLLLLFIIFICATLCYFFGTHTFYNKKYNADYRTITVGKKNEEGQYLYYDDYAFLDTMEHVSYHTTGEYGGEFLLLKDKKEAFIYVLPLFDKRLLPIKTSHTPLKDKEAICSSYLYPYEFDREGIDIKKGISKNKILGSTLEFEKGNVQVVDVFFPRNREGALNLCYVSLGTYERLTKNEPDYYKHLVYVDAYENVEAVKDAIRVRDLSARSPDAEDGNTILFILVPFLLMLVILILSFYVLYNFIKKKCVYHVKRYGILKSSGYLNKDIISLEVLENFIVVGISSVLSFIAFVISYSVITKKVFCELLFSGWFSVKTPILVVVCSIGVYLFLVFISIQLLLTQYMKKDISALIRGE